jgi:hypothetical protein
LLPCSSQYSFFLSQNVTLKTYESVILAAFYMGVTLVFTLRDHHRLRVLRTGL